MYLIIGWNSIVHSLTNMFESRGIEFKIYPINDKNFETKNKDISNNVFSGDIEEILKNRKECKILLLQKSNEDRIKFLEENYEKLSNFTIISIVPDEEEEEKLREFGVDFLLREDSVLSSSLIKKIDDLKNKLKSKDLIKKLTNSDGEVAIFVHNNPDPDALASAMALEKICELTNTDSTTYYNGDIGHPENEIFLENTGFKLQTVNDKNINSILDKSGTIVFLDFAKPTVNNILPKGTKADIIIDHHITNIDTKSSGFVDIRTDVGATSTILTLYLQELNIKLSPILASALLYGIKVDTGDYTKNIWTSDFKVISYLSAIADKELLDIFESAPINPSTMSALGRAISNRNFEGGVLTAFAGNVSRRDDIPQIANILSREKDIGTVLVYGIMKDTIYLSARCKELSINIGDKMKKTFSSIGKAGGHKHSAGGRIQKSKFKNKEDMISTIENNFRKEVLK